MMPAGAAGAAVGGGSGAASSDSSPVDLATPVDMADGMAHPTAVIRAGKARIEVLSATLLRLEYSPSGNFENGPTVNAVNRRLPVPAYRSGIADGWLTVRTSRALLRYRIGSGPFTPENTSLQLSVAGVTTTVHPTWEWECTFGQVCQAGAAITTGGASISQTSSGYESTAGYVGNLIATGSRATWQVLGAPAGTAELTLRYSTYPVVFNPPAARTFELVVNGRMVTTLTVPPTESDNEWADLTTTVPLRPGTNSVAVLCGVGDGCDANMDTMSVTPLDSTATSFAPTEPLGGWMRGFDTATYNITPTCGPGQAGATCEAGLQPLTTDGLLDAAGWRLLDDTHGAVWTGRGWVRTRPVNGDVEDGYLFAYGHDYAGALQSLAQLTGPAPMLDRAVFGVWYSDYTPYSSAALEQSVYPEFVANGVPLDTLSLDTDWKSPSSWNGWEWNGKLFPDPRSFLAWAHDHGIEVTLNLHSSIDDNDPRLPETRRIAGNTLAGSNCSDGPCKVWNWSSIPQAESNFSLQQSFQRQGVAFWWLDWCCDASVVSMSGVTPDSWIDHLYAQQMTDSGQRGFVLARIGSSNGDPEEVYPAGAWSDHTSSIAFTGDAWGTWNTLAREAELTPAEASIGEPYVSDDIGSYLGPPPTQSGADPPDLYDRWVQLGTFQPILRLHSNNEDRLPWQYPEPVRNDTENFLRLREALVPYTYTLAAEANQTGLPMARPLYLDFPGSAAAYTNPTEYLYGPDVLVAPVTAPGNAATTSVWFPPGRWVDYFTGATFTGPSTASLVEPLSRMPVFVRAGGIVPEQPSTSRASSGPSGTLMVKAYAGSDGSFDLYQDAGSGLAYQKGQHAETTIAVSSSGGSRSTRVTVGSARGRYPGQAPTISYQVQMVDLSLPSGVTLNGAPLAERPVGSTKPGWFYQASTDTVVVMTGPRSIAQPTTVAANGTGPVSRAEPATVLSS